MGRSRRDKASFKNKKLKLKMASKQSTKEVTPEDQKKINLFARKHRSFKDKQDELENLKLKLQKLNDEESDGKVPFMVGDIFILQSPEQAQQSMEASKVILQEKISKTTDEKDGFDKEIKALKADLYAKFGDEINLEE